MAVKDHRELAKEYREGKHEFKHPANRIKFAEMHERAGKSTPRSKALKKEYTGHYQETATGQIRHQSTKQVSKKKLSAY